MILAFDSVLLMSIRLALRHLLQSVWWQYLQQPVFNPTVKTRWNPRHFWYRERLELLEKCWNYEVIRHLEQCWKEPLRDDGQDANHPHSV